MKELEDGKMTNHLTAINKMIKENKNKGNFVVGDCVSIKIKKKQESDSVSVKDKAGLYLGDSMYDYKIKSYEGFVVGEYIKELTEAIETS